MELELEALDHGLAPSRERCIAAAHVRDSAAAGFAAGKGEERGSTGIGHHAPGFDRADVHVHGIERPGVAHLLGEAGVVFQEEVGGGGEELEGGGGGRGVEGLIEVAEAGGGKL